MNLDISDLNAHVVLSREGTEQMEADKLPNKQRKNRYITKFKKTRITKTKL